MNQPTIYDLQDLLAEGKWAIRYYMAHYDEIASRPAAHTLYGPHDITDLGAAGPSPILTKPKVHKLSTKKRNRKNYLIYDLDESCNLIRVTCILDESDMDYIDHCFERNGVLYMVRETDFAYPCSDIPYKTMILKYNKGKIVLSVVLYSDLLYAEYYEYLPDGQMHTYTYAYHIKRTHTRDGQPVIPDAPFGSSQSPVNKYDAPIGPRTFDFTQFVQK